MWCFPSEYVSNFESLKQEVICAWLVYKAKKTPTLFFYFHGECLLSKYLVGYRCLCDENWTTLDLNINVTEELLSRWLGTGFTSNMLNTKTKLRLKKSNRTLQFKLLSFQFPLRKLNTLGENIRIGSLALCLGTDSPHIFYKINSVLLPLLCPSQSSCKNLNRSRVNSSCCKTFSPLKYINTMIMWQLLWLTMQNT